MSIAYQSYQTAQFVGTSAVVTKPTSLAVGDLMIGWMQYYAIGTSITLPSGWTLLFRTESTIHQAITGAIAYKIADAGDVAASNFTFSSSATGGGHTIIIRITGTRSVFTIPAYSGNVIYNSGYVTTSSITPDVPSLIMLFYAGSGSNERLDGTESIDVSPPTFTSVPDSFNNSSFSYGYRTATTPTGTASGTVTSYDGNTNSIFQMIAVSELQNYTVTVSDTVVDTDTQSAISGKFSTIQDSVTISDSIDISSGMVWDTTDKSDTDWTNVEK